ncbi:hypothetical protein [Bifidobacterium simiarum]|uniref:Toxin n=1 Tax=Bifidobacterium simiarum TaxID=2045441 RepID=A0A2M9HEV2_9BIFI|nr:hypothetical protein [Bifidobacterium simiarum]PJM75348.1 hypothetical protein CSQ87_04860 [Bifidobacterium simiarum]
MNDHFIWFDSKFPWQVYLRIREDDVPAKILRSAYKHQLTTTDIIHAWRTSIGPIAVDDSREDAVYIFLGPKPHAMSWIELGVIFRNDIPIIAHAMKARPKYLRKAGLL